MRTLICRGNSRGITFTPSVKLEKGKRKIFHEVTFLSSTIQSSGEVLPTERLKLNKDLHLSYVNGKQRFSENRREALRHAIRPLPTIPEEKAVKEYRSIVKRLWKVSI